VGKMLKFKDIKNNRDLIKDYKSREEVFIVCDYCDRSFSLKKNVLQARLKHFSATYCSTKCQHDSTKTIQTVSCSECQKPVRRQRHQKSKSDRRFCNQSCAATYNNKHKTYGIRRSKLEAYLEEQIRLEYPNLEMTCNNKDIIGSELDFYFPQLKLAIELNGIFHYEPIYGQDKLEKIQNNDKQKMRRCLEEGIEFCVVDSSSCSYLSKHNKTKYLNIFKQIIEPLLGRAV
jgi:hypothetical protein